MATKTLDLDLAEPVPSVWGMERYEKLYVLVRFRDSVLGWVTVDRPEGQPVVTADRLYESLVAKSIWPLSQALLKARLAPAASPAAPPPISVVIVCSQGRSTQLIACLSALEAATYPRAEVIVVDAYPGAEAVEETARRFKASYVRSDHPGLNAARNRGIAAARHEIVAFTLDRARPDRNWLRRLGRMFLQPNVQAVTGLVAPAELGTLAQHRLEFDFGAQFGLQETAFRIEELGEAGLLWARHVGAGANMAIRRTVFASIGGFDPRLSRHGDGSGDLEMLHRLIARGHPVHYQPGAITWLTHERSDAALPRRLYENGRDYGVYLLTCWRTGTCGAWTLLRFAAKDWLYGRIVKRFIRPHGIPRRLILDELRGALASPAAFLYGRARGRQVEGILPPEAIPAEPAAHAPRPIQRRPTPTIAPGEPLPGSTPIRIVRTWYPHWGHYAGMNQYLRHLNRQAFHVSEWLVQENDGDFPIRHAIVQNWLRHRVQRHGMAWYNLSDFAAELRTLPDYLRPSRAALLHYLDGEHAAQFLPARRRSRARPATLVTYHQPPDVLARVARLDVARRFDCITVVAPEQEEFFRGQVGSTPVRLILHGIDTRYYHPAPRVEPSATVRCITVGHNYRDYGAVRAVAERLRSVTQLEFHVVSPRATGVEDLPNVRCHRGLTDDELVRLYQRADILFLPLTKATANNSLLEGMACGLPVLSTSLPSIHAYTTRAAAILVERNNPDHLADALMYLVEHAWARNTMGAAARKKAEELDWRNIAPLFESLYAELIAR